MTKPYTTRDYIDRSYNQIFPVWHVVNKHYKGKVELHYMLKDQAERLFKDIDNPTDEEWFLYIMSAEITSANEVDSIWGYQQKVNNRYISDTRQKGDKQ